ncbi:GrpB family protein [Segetibacter sp. 3557_3]|uniref:GrpB family protein n=1 Tax=Segetibacter sp. 3557_3 TaxID=2547429 RepID=UPI00105867B0|nr:GrpB family protein [Segetibacter sp. 3557_3]TDH28570.1 GrpB family protein [Segetibacter sp. 3557_3]
MMELRIVDYDPGWPAAFEAIKLVYKAHLGKLIIDIQHVGSTSVPGLGAKPVLDIDLVIDNMNVLPAIIQQLGELGYIPLGEMGITGRYAFKQVLVPDNQLNPARNWPKHHLYVCEQHNVALSNHLHFRDQLRKDRKLATQYGELKRSLAKNCTNMDEYVSGKTGFIVEVLKTAGLDEQSLKTIVQNNTSNQLGEIK